MDAILETAKTIGIAIAEIILAVYFCKQYLDKATKGIDISSGIKKQNEVDLKIIERMDYFKELLSADRILLFEFHNGQHYSNYRSALKMSASYEVFRAGLESSRDKCTGLPIAIMPKFIADITQKGMACCHDIEEIRYDMGNSYEFKKAIGIKSFYDIAIRDKDCNVIGFVAIQWNHIVKDFPEEDMKHLAWFLEEAVKELVARDHEIKKAKPFKWGKKK